MADQPTQNPAPRTTPAPARAKQPAQRSMVRRSPALVRRWARDTFNREQVLSSLRALMWVAPLTLLIWIYAEREQQAVRTAQFQIVVKSADPTQVASFTSASDQNVRATLKGPRARLEAATEKLDPRSNAGAVQIVIDGNRSPGQYEVDILAQIQKDYRLDGSGITIQDCTPRQVRVEVDRLEEIELEVRADPQARFLSPPVFDPRTVKISAPAAAIRNAMARGALYATANLTNLASGRHSLKAVPVTVEGLTDARATLRPSTVSANVDVGQADVRYKIASLPISPNVTVDLQAFATHDLQFDRFLSNVWVYGPPDKIRDLEKGTLTPRPEATFKVTDKDLGRQQVVAPIKYDLPEGIRLADEAPKTITFDLLRKE